MTHHADPAPIAAWQRRVGIALSVLVVLALAADAIGKACFPEAMIANSPPLGLPADPAFHRGLGLLLAACVALHVWPRTAVLGAVLLTGFLGGAVATHLRVGSPPLTFTLVGVYLGALMWAGLWLRDRRVRALLS